MRPSRLFAHWADKPWIEAEYNVAGNIVRAEVVIGVWGNARCLIRLPAAVRWTISSWRSRPVPAAVGGGGQPIHFNEERAAQRGQVLYNYDSANKMRSPPRES